MIHIFGRVSLAIVPQDIEDNLCLVLNFDNLISSSYVPFCDDFGPMNLATVHEFCEILTSERDKNQDRPIVVQSSCDARSLTNTTFLLGAYMIMQLQMTVDATEKVFAPVSHKILSYRDVCPGHQNFSLYVRDCWAGLYRAKSLSWVDFSADGFDRHEYAELDSPMNADLHEVVPGKFIAMRGPKDLLDGAQWEDTFQSEGCFSHRDFSPAHYAEILGQFDVRAVVRLNTHEYDAGGFRTAGIAVADLYFDDCSVPPVEVVAEFFTLAEGLPGALAVHCKAGLGRTGTLIALYIMKHHGFTAREAMGWLRIVRPGSVIGQQQQFLCDKEALMHQCGEAYRRRSGGRLAPLPVDADLQAVEAYVAAAARDIRIRTAAITNAAPHSFDESRECRGAALEAAGTEAEALAAHVAEAANRRSGRRWTA
jgi:cell division cycle 14